MARRKIAILGGGMASLTTAYHLTRTEALREAHEVTVYQIGWRLGGKGATGRDERMRILEHGLHIWFGYYDNAFRMLRQVFRDWERGADHALGSWHDAFHAQSFTPIGPDFFPLNWPDNDGVPGDGHVFWTPWQAFTQMLSLVAATLRTWHDDREQAGRPHASTVAVPSRIASRLESAGVRSAGGAIPQAHHAMQSAAEWAAALGPTHHGPLASHLPDLAELVGVVHEAFAATCPAPGDDAGHGLMVELLDIFRGFAHGFVHDFMILGKTAREVDAVDFRAWLVEHGTTPEVAARSFIVRALYDTMFQYIDGDLERPSYAAGTAAQVVLRMFGTTKGAALYEMQAGMGEVVVSPLYQLLRQRGVQFRFFREVTRLALDPSRRVVEQVHLSVQAQVKQDEYRPTRFYSGLDCWPAQPFWDQLVDGDALRDAGVDFESPWSAYKPAGTEVLQHGRDFHEVVLGICLGAFKKLNEDPTLVDELTAASPAFKAMTESFSLLPSLALQVWSPLSLADLGWTLPKPAMVAGVEPLDIWADMSQTLRYESPDSAAKSVHYLTGVLPSEAFRQPRRARGTQREAELALTRTCQDWLASQGPRLWPKAVTADGRFDWDVLLADASVTGPARVQQQYVRANVSPAECCVVSAAGKTRHRLKAGASGFANLTLAGTWVDTGFNTECIEAAVMSGMQAARAVCGSPQRVIGEDLLQQPGHGLGPLAPPLQCLERVGQAVAQRLPGLQGLQGLQDARGLLRCAFGARQPQGQEVQDHQGARP